MDAKELFTQLCRKLNVESDRDGEAHIPCPGCGKEPKRGHIHFSFSERGGNCFVCGYQIGIFALAKIVGFDLGKKYEPPLPPPPKPIKEKPDWLKQGWEWVTKYNQNPLSQSKWAHYRGVSNIVVKLYWLGYGTLPPYSSRCQHPRLIVPLIVGHQVVGLRARTDDCKCDKWLSASGTERLLYNGGFLAPTNLTQLRLGNSSMAKRNGIVVITENAIDALQIEELCGGWAAVATLGTANWLDEWTQALLEYKPEDVIIAFDHDLAGNGASNQGEYKQMLADWHTRNPKSTKVPTPAGITLINRLLKAGLPATLYQWPKSAPLKFDIGAMLGCPY